MYITQVLWKNKDIALYPPPANVSTDMLAQYSVPRQQAQRHHDWRNYLHCQHAGFTGLS